MFVCKQITAPKNLYKWVDIFFDMQTKDNSAVSHIYVYTNQILSSKRSLCMTLPHPDMDEINDQSFNTSSGIAP